MEKGKRLFSRMGSVFAFCMLLALTVLLPGARADAKLSLEAIDYDKSTITIGTDSASDTALYFSDKNKKKWETAMDSFVGNKCTMDISWVSVTKDYIITFKGDKTVDDILTVTIPKQVSNFKVKYNKKENKVEFTNKPAGRTVEYRKNNTSNWATVNESPSSNFGDSLQKLYENGGKIYFRLKAENGQNGAGLRYSKEVLCSIPKKSEAPKVTINNDATITVKSGWQVRRVKIKESGGTEYVIGYGLIDTTPEVNNIDNAEQWYTYRSEKDIPVTEMAADLKPNSAEEAVYLQFRKEASSSAQVSRITTVKIPRQESAPAQGDISIEYTSSTTFNLKIEKATTKTPYEYCILGESDVRINGTGYEIIDPQDAKWKTVSSNVATEIKKSEAPVNSVIFFRKKAVGSVGSDDFKLATDYTNASARVTYPQAENGTLTVTTAPKINSDGSIDVIDGVCTTSNEDGQIKFNIVTNWNAKIKEIHLCQKKSPEKGDANAAAVSVTSSVAKSKDAGKYNITATITEIKLTDTAKNTLDNSGSLKLYAYIEYDSSSGDSHMTSTDGTTDADRKGLVINLTKKSSIELDSTSNNSTMDIKRIIGAKGTKQNELVSFKSSFGAADVKNVQLGSYELGNNCYAFSTSGGDNIFTVKMTEIEKNEKLETYYGKEQKLVVELNNGEKLDNIKITLIEPVSLSKFYSWAFRSSSLVTEQTVTTKQPNGTETTETKKVNSYSVEYAKSAQSVNGVTVTRVVFKSATLNGVDIVDNVSSDGTGKIEFSNARLKDLTSVTSEPVNITFTITLSNNETYDYTIKHGCLFTVLP